MGGAVRDQTYAISEFLTFTSHPDAVELHPRVLLVQCFSQDHICLPPQPAFGDCFSCMERFYYYTSFINPPPGRALDMDFMDGFSGGRVDEGRKGRAHIGVISVILFLGAIVWGCRRFPLPSIGLGFPFW